MLNLVRNHKLQGLPNGGPGCSSTVRTLQLLSLALMIASGAGAVAAPGTMTAHLDRATVAVGESVTLTLTFEGVSPKAPPNLPPLANLQASFAGQSSSFTFVN